MKRMAKLVGALLALVLVMSACTAEAPEESKSDDSGAESKGKDGDSKGGDGEAPESCENGKLKITGSSTVQPISDSVKKKYENACDGAEITVDGPGTGDGFKDFCDDKADISDASRQIKDEEKAACDEAGIEYVEIKVALDGIAVLTSNDNAIECLSFPDLYALLGDQSEDVKKWSDANDLATKVGSDVAPYPDANLDISAPGTESGTYDSFIEIVLEKQAEEHGGADPFIRTDFSGLADDNQIIEGISGSEASLGWVGFAFAQANKDKVKALPITKEVGGECVEPTPETINTGDYPVSRSLYIYVSKNKMADNPLLASYVDFYLDAAYSDSVVNAFSEGAGYIELAEEDLKKSKDAWEQAK